MKKMWRKSGFALLELAVVAAFVSSVSFTAYQVIRKGNEAACQNNLKQIYLALVDFQMSNGFLPNAVFFPISPDDPKGINNLLKDNLGGSKGVFFCPVIPAELNKHGTNYLWNDTVSGKNLDGIPDSTWLMTEVTSVSPDAPAPHTRGYHILYADGTVNVGPRVNFPVLKPSPKQPAVTEEPEPEPEVTVKPAEAPSKIRVENLPEKIVAGKLRMKIVGYDASEKLVPVDKMVSIVSVNDSIQPETVMLSKGVWEGEVLVSKSVQGDTILIVDEAGKVFSTAVVGGIGAGPWEQVSLNIPDKTLRAGESFETEVLMQDGSGNVCREWEGKLILESSDPDARMPKELILEKRDGGLKKIPLAFFKAGSQKLMITASLDSGRTISGEKAFVLNPGAIDHFAIDKINSPKIAGETFNVIIHSKDRWENTVKGFHLNDATGTLKISRESYISGVRLEEVLITKAAKETFLTVEDGNNHFGKSNPFEVKPALPAQLRLDGVPRVVVMGREYKFTVMFSDRYGNVISEYAADFECTSSDRNFQFSDKFLVVFGTPGKQVLTVKDKKTGVTLDWAVVVIK